MKSRSNPGGAALPGQLHFPGMESQTANLARMIADLPLKAHADQAPCDIGLFSDDAAQADLVDIARKR